MTDITIPPEALEAAAREIRADFEGLFYTDPHAWTECARAAILAALENWPRMERNFWADDGAPVLIIPVPQEPSHE